MLKKIRDKRPLEIINHFGVEHQKRKFGEESGELRDAIVEVELRDQDYICERHEEILLDEVADNIVMLLQFIQYYDLPIDKINDRVDYKLTRTIEEEMVKDESIRQTGVMGPIQKY